MKPNDTDEQLTRKRGRIALMSVKIFFCYAHEDEPLLNELRKHLRPLQRQGLIGIWYDRDISAGKEWEHEIDKYLTAADIILLLVSPDFIDSDYCYSLEMKKALERHERREARVIPIILRPVYWQGGPLNKLQALPADAKPVTDPTWQSIDRALYNVTESIIKVVGEMILKASLSLSAQPSQLLKQELIGISVDIPQREPASSQILLAGKKRLVNVSQDTSRYVPVHFFISYSQQDKSKARSVKSILKSKGIEVWLEDIAITYEAGNREKKVRDAIRSSFALILLISNNSWQSLNVLGELSIAQSRNCPIYLLWIEGETWADCVPMDFIKARYIDCRGDRFQPGSLEFVDELKRIIQNRAVNHFILNPDEEIPSTYFEVKLADGLRIAFRLASYETLAGFLSDLYISYLDKQYKPFSYGLDWFMLSDDDTTGMHLMKISRIILPWSWLKSFSKNLPDEFEPGWDNMPLTKWGIKSSTCWKITHLRPKYVFGVITDDTTIAGEINSFTEKTSRPFKQAWFRFVGGKWKNARNVREFATTPEVPLFSPLPWQHRSSAEYFQWIFMSYEPIKHNGMVLFPTTDEYYHQLREGETGGSPDSLKRDRNWKL